MSLERQKVTKYFNPFHHQASFKGHKRKDVQISTWVALYHFIVEAQLLGQELSYNLSNNTLSFEATAEETDQEYKDRLLNQKDKIHAEIAKLNKQAKEIDEKLK